VLIALSVSRFSCRPAGVPVLVTAICALADEITEDRLVYLGHRSDRRYALTTPTGGPGPAWSSRYPSAQARARPGGCRRAAGAWRTSVRWTLSSKWYW